MLSGLNHCMDQASILTDHIFSDWIAFAFVSIPLLSLRNAILSRDTVLGTSKPAFDHKKMYNGLHVLYYNTYVQENKHVRF